MTGTDTTISAPEGLNANKSARRFTFSWTANFYSALKALFDRPSTTTTITATKTKIEFRPYASVTENLENLKGWLAQKSAEKDSNTYLRFVGSVPLTELCLPLEGSPIPNPIKVQQAWWLQGNGDQTSVLFLYARPVPEKTDDVAIAVCGKRYDETESLGDAYKRNGGNAAFSDVIGKEGLENLATLINVHGKYKRPSSPLRPSQPEVGKSTRTLAGLGKSGGPAS